MVGLTNSLYSRQVIEFESDGIFVSKFEQNFGRAFEMVSVLSQVMWQIHIKGLKADFLSWQKPLASSLRVLADNFSLLPAPQRVLAVWFMPRHHNTTTW